MGRKEIGLHVRILIKLMVIFFGTLCAGQTDLLDVAAINRLHAALGSPPLHGWKAVGGDPCSERWQGVHCVSSNITAICLGGMNLSGELGSNLDFPSIKQMDLSHNHIGGIIPSTLPPNLRNFSLSGNQLTGSIPVAIASLTQLSDLSLNNNLLSGQIPDVFQLLTGLKNLDLSRNNLSGQLPRSIRNLSSLTTLHLQNNQLSGTLNVLRNLPLKDLNVEHNLFFGRIHPKLPGIPNFRKGGNPFNTTIIAPPPAAVPSPMAPSPKEAEAPWVAANSSITLKAPTLTSSRKYILKPKSIMWIAIAGFTTLIAFGVCLFMLRCVKRRSDSKIVEGHDAAPLNKPTLSDSFVEVTNQEDKVVGKPPNSFGVQIRRTNLIPKMQDEQEMHAERLFATTTCNDYHELENIGLGSKFSSHHLLIAPGEKIIINPTKHVEATGSQVTTSSLKGYTIASLQQYTNSFSPKNLIGEGTFGPVYRAEPPDGKLLAVRKLEAIVSGDQSHEQFLQFVSCISRLQHVNIVRLLGCCAEHGQRLLVYEYCSNGTLHDALHTDNELCSKLSWNARINMALGAARALEYLHEKVQPPIVHQNLKSANILLNDKLEVCVSDCGLGPLLSSGSADQGGLGPLLSSGSADQLSRCLPSAYGYGSSEFESGSYAQQNDVFSFGVVMLELLTGRKSYDRTRPRGEQSLIRWAIPQLHDIDALSKMVDPCLKGTYPMKSLSRFADIISSCVQREPEFRPAMSEIVQDLLQMTQRNMYINENELR